MSKRYVIDPSDSWRQLSERAGITIETRDVIERYTSGSTVKWPEGARRVKAPGKRTRVFIGEFAWADAERLARDYEIEIERETWGR